MRLGKTWLDMIYVHPPEISTVALWKRRLALSRMFVVPAGMAYVLGDNQEGSLDSREFGCVPMSRILPCVGLIKGRSNAFA